MSFLVALLLISVLFLFYRLFESDRKISGLEAQITELNNCNDKMIELAQTLSKGQELGAKAVQLMSKQSTLLSKDFYDFRDQAASGFNMIADFMASSDGAIEEMPKLSTEDKEKKSN